MLFRITIKVYLLISLICIVVSGSNSQNQLLTYRGFNENDGLGVKYCYSVAEDNDGFIWLGAGDGLYRYDGHKFTQYLSPLDSGDHHISSLLISVLYDKEYNRLWLMSTSDLQYFDLQTYTFHKWSNEDLGFLTKENEYRSLTKLNKDKLLITYGKYIFEYNIKNQKFKDITDILLHNEDHQLKFVKLYPYDLDHVTLILPNKCIVVHTESLEEKFRVNGSEKDYFQNVYYDQKREKLYISSTSSLLVYDINLKKLTRHSKQYKTSAGKILNYIMTVFVDFNEDKLLFPLENFDVYFDKNMEQFDLVLPHPLSKNHRINPNNIYVDSKKNIWCTSYQSFCSVLYNVNKDITSTKLLINSDGVSIEPYKTVKYNDSLHLFSGSGITGIGVLKNDGKYEIIANSHNPGNRVYDICVLPTKRILTCDGVNVNEVHLKNKSFSKLITWKQVYYISMLNDSILIGAGENNIYALNIRDHYSNKDLSDFFNQRKEIENYDFKILKKHNGKLYIKSNFGIYTINENLKIQLINFPKSSNSNSYISKVECMEVDKNNNIWFGTLTHGLFKYEVTSNIIKNINKDNSLLNNNIIHHMTNDINGTVWLASGEKVYTLDVENEEITAEYDVTSGLPGGGYGVFSSLDDEIISYNQYPFILLRKIQNRKRTSPNQHALYITDVIVNNKSILNKPISMDTSLTLFHNENNICLTFTNISTFNANKNRYRYKVLEMDSSWNILEENKLCLQRLAAGSYSIVIEGTDNYGIWQEDTVKVNLKIKPIYYQSTWFILLLGLILSFLLYKLYLWRVGQIRRTEFIKTEYKKHISELEMKALRAQMNPHFIFNSLNSIQKFIFDKDEYAASQYLTKFSRLIRLILDHSDQDFITLESEKELLMLYLEMEGLRFGKVFHYEVIFDEKLNNNTKLPSMIIQPHIENAIWHGLLHLPKSTNDPEYREGRLLVEVKKINEKEIFITVEDNGVGREKAILYKSKQLLRKKSYGSSISEERIRIFNEMHGIYTKFTILDLKSGNGLPMGTKVQITLAFSATNTEEV